MRVTIRFVSAGAGTGKTHRLTELLRSRLSSGAARPEAVIATTFTRRAAAELVERVRRGLLADGQRLAAVAIGQATIGTVNAVCGQLLARFAFEAGLSPRLEVLAEHQQPLLFAQAVDLAVTRDDVQAMNALAARLGQEDWQATVRRLVDLGRANDIPVEAFAGHARRSLDELLDFFPPPAAEDLDARLADALAQAIRAIGGNGDATKKTAEFGELMGAAADELAAGAMPWSRWVALAKKAPAAESLASVETVRRAAACYDQHPGLREDLRQWVERAYDVAARASAAYQRLKAARGLLDFVDQEREVLRLLDRPDVAAVLRDELDLLLVDEFQDTSPIQLALFVKLAALARECIWVGDLKQAIYGFRGADPALMAAVVEQLQGAGESVEVLDRSFRSRPSLVALANAAFAPAFAASLPAHQVRLRAQRPEVLDHPPLRLWQLEGTNVSQRAAALAQGVARLLASGIEVVDPTRGERRVVRPGDVALLARTNDSARAFGGALAAAGVPVSLEQPGLLATPEGHLALACLRRVLDAEDTLASAEIVALKRACPAEAWLEDRLAYLAEGRPPARWGVDGASAEPALRALEGVRARLAGLSPAELLDEVLAAADLRVDAIAWGPDPVRSAQRLANLETLRRLARDYEAECGSLRTSATASGLFLWLQDLAAERRDFVAVDGRADAVRVLTHHGAKGLEWPVVILADLEAPVRPRLWEPTAVDDAGPVDLRAPLACRRLRYWPWPFGGHRTGVEVASRIDASSVGAADRETAVAEAVRLLYVGLTRARDVLVLALAARAKQRPWLDALGADWLIRETDGAVRPPDGEPIACLRETFDGAGAPAEAVPAPATESCAAWLLRPAVPDSEFAAIVDPSVEPPRGHIGGADPRRLDSSPTSLIYPGDEGQTHLCLR